MRCFEVSQASPKPCLLIDGGVLRCKQIQFMEIKYKSYGTAIDEVLAIMDELIECTEIGTVKKRIVADVEIWAFTNLYKTLNGTKRLCLNGEFDDNRMVVIYEPCEDCIILILSEPLKKLKSKQIKFNYN